MMPAELTSQLPSVPVIERLGNRCLVWLGTKGTSSIKPIKRLSAERIRSDCAGRSISSCRHYSYIYQSIGILSVQFELPLNGDLPPWAHHDSSPTKAESPTKAT